jgi:hypothetical protein
MKKLTILVIVAGSFMLFAFKFFEAKPATNFLYSLSEEQLEKAQFPFDDLSRTTWHFLPGAMWPRVGLQLGELNEGQKELLFKLLRNNLSEIGYGKVTKIMDLENVLLELGQGDASFRDSNKYFITFYGNPEKDSLWAWSFEGHHLSLNFSVYNNKISIAPRFMGASPATILEGKRKGQRTLANEEDFGLELINSLSEDQKKIAIFQKTSYADIVTSNATEVSPLQPVGIKIGDLKMNQQAILISLMEEYLSTMPKDLAEKRIENLKSEEFNEIRFGWAGATEYGKAHYYRIQGKSFLVEFDNSQNNANHIHLVWRDFNGDFGKDLIKEHYDHSHH